MVNFYIPKFKDYKPQGKLEILPSPAPDEVYLKCTHCGNINILDKSEVYENKSLACWDCKQIYVIENIPDDIKAFLKNKESYNINQRPRIVRR